MERYSVLNDLTDVDTITSAPSGDELLIYNGSSWVPSLEINTIIGGQTPSSGTFTNLTINDTTDSTDFYSSVVIKGGMAVDKNANIVEKLFLHKNEDDLVSNF